MVHIMSKRSSPDYLHRGDVVFIHGWFRHLMGVCLNNRKVVIQGIFRTKTVELKKYDKKRYRIYREGKLINYVRFK